jgi:hypothetical protein
VRRRAHRIARLLAPAAAALGGFASAEARVETGLGIRLRPDVCVSLGEPPYDGLLVSPPLLVVVLATPGAVGAWLALGTEAVWTTAGGQGRRHQADGTVVAVPPSGTLDVPGRPGLELGVGELLARQASVVEQPAVRSARLLR